MSRRTPATTDSIFAKALELQPVSADEALKLYIEAPLAELLAAGYELRQTHRPGIEVGWIIDRNVNITNICYSCCSFCAFCRKKGSSEGYITTREEYRDKIEELFRAGGEQLLLQGGMHPDLGLDFYTTLFSDLKREYPGLKLHALGPPEIVSLAKREGLSYRKVLEALVSAGLDSLPGAGAEILSNRVRKILSPAKATAGEWIGVMRVAHAMRLPTTATMMFGHIERIDERIDHLIKLRELQNESSGEGGGFTAFIPWPCITPDNKRESGPISDTGREEYLRLISVSRIVLNNITNIQASLLTVGPDTAAMSLHAGANDLGSVLIEENVLSSAGGGYRTDPEGIKGIITAAGFLPVRRDQLYRPVE